MNERQRDMLNRLLDGFEGKLTSSKWAKIKKCSPDTALRDITDLMQRGILARDEGGGRSTSYSLAADRGRAHQRMKGLPPVNTQAQARAIMAAGLGQAELEFVLSLTAPLYWIIHEAEGYRVRNGSAFFLNTDEGVFCRDGQSRH